MGVPPPQGGGVLCLEETDARLSSFDISHQYCPGDAVHLRSMRRDRGYLLFKILLKRSQGSIEFLVAFLRIAATKTKNDDPTKT